MKICTSHLMAATGWLLIGCILNDAIIMSDVHVNSNFRLNSGWFYVFTASKSGAMKPEVTMRYRRKICKLSRFLPI
jgi:hypothetical protein